MHPFVWRPRAVAVESHLRWCDPQIRVVALTFRNGRRSPLAVIGAGLSRLPLRVQVVAPSDSAKS